jgi:hypothetical protein
MFVLACVCALAPATAHADDGGWLDWLYRLDPKLVGLNTDFHALCLDDSNKRVENCEEWFQNLYNLLIHRKLEHLVEYREIRHEFDVRVGFYWKYGKLFPDLDKGSVHGLRLMGMYYYHFPNVPWLKAGGGAGLMRFTGDQFEKPLPALILTPSVVFLPSGRLKGSTIHVEGNYLTQGLKAGTFDSIHNFLTFADKGEWNFSVAFGFDLRRLE